MKTLTIIGMLVVMVFFMFPEVKNPDKPVNGEWDFKPEEVWKVDTAGSEVFASPAEVLVSDEGKVYIGDEKNEKFYLFTAGGKFVKSFMPKGEGPGEIKQFIRAYLVGNKVIAGDMDRLHYFSGDGVYIKSVKNNFFRTGPDFFLNENEFIYFPLLILNPRQPTGKIYHYNLKTGTSKELIRFQVFKGGVSRRSDGALALVVKGLTPLMVVGRDPDKMYYGFNSSYEVNVSDYNGKKLNAFSLDREKRKVSRQAKRDYFKGSNFPPDMLEEIIRNTPDEMTYFGRIEIHNQLVYVYESNLARSLKRQKIDIFSAGGKYLYRAFIDVGQDYSLVPSTLVIKNNYLYVGQEDEEGEVMMVKYKISLPQLSM